MRDFGVKDNLSLIAAAAGGFMLFVALTGVLRGTPLVSWQSNSSFSRPASEPEQAYAIPTQVEELWQTSNIFNTNTFNN
ncbi:hypothetical protein BC008_37095 [Mastigocoleus testarum BC008]|uniref:Uncharacterized protein n=1 Tax=Mastigocoleus testarum BC008 TaxID=371196 RepID=A0A0V7ZCW7_9CYAN|nr:hypothetical protein BC008_09085 [Mastigocoleus testarum BC008]KST70264.1 hypothetical protein BC008_37095 [Mastigocoleus testarum BC008]